jgi:CHASE2 domain-containing sensor protein
VEDDDVQNQNVLQHLQQPLPDDALNELVASLKQANNY